MKAWRRERMPRRFHYGTHPTRLTNVIVIPETGWTLDYAPQGASRTQARHARLRQPRPGYAHGILRLRPASARATDSDRFQNQNMYLILCRLLGIEPAPNDGEWRDIKRMFNEN